MSKRRKEIKKRKRLVEGTLEQENLRAEESFEEIDTRPDEAPQDPDTPELHPADSPIDDSQIVSASKPSPSRKPAPERQAQDRKPVAPAADSWLGRNKENFLLGLLVLYVLLLGLGTVGELFEIEWILNLPLFK